MRTLLFDQPVSRLLCRVRRLAPEQQKQTWKAYAILRRGVRQEPLTPNVCEQQLLGLIAAGVSYPLVSLALKLAQAYTWQWFGARGAGYRARKALAHEFFHLVRRQTRHALGMRVLPNRTHWTQTKQEAPPGLRPWQAVCDGSHKARVSSAGILVLDPEGVERAEVAVTVPARTAVYAELWACIRALQTLRLFGTRRAHLKVDSLSVIRALEEQLPLHYCVEEAELHLLVAEFDSLEVELVPRVETSRADALAASLSSH